MKRMTTIVMMGSNSVLAGAASLGLAAALSSVIPVTGASLLMGSCALGVAGLIGRGLHRRGKRSEVGAWAQRAGATEETKSRFLSNVSHELRTPMTAILGYVDLLESEGRDAAEHDELVRSIRRNAQHLTTLMVDVLDLAQLETEQPNLKLAAISPMQLVEEVLGEVESRARVKSLTVIGEIVPSVPTAIQTDASRVRQVLVQLMDNAIKFTDQGSVTLRVSMVEGSRGADSRIRFEVIDTGVGLDALQVREIFEPFKQGDGSHSRKHGGLGIGLTIARRVAELLGGGITVKSVPGRGANFVLTISAGDLTHVTMRETLRATDCVQSGLPAMTVERFGERPLSGLKILYAEDGSDNRRLVCFHLRHAGATVETAENGRIGRDMALEAVASSRPFDIILMDMQMPELDGYSATSQLRGKGYRKPIVALTAHALAGDREKCLSAGCDEYLTKPIDRHVLVATCARIFGGDELNAKGGLRRTNRKGKGG